MYDIFGDVHGRSTELEALLLKLGYIRRGNSFRHGSRRAIFLGDFIDRGSHQRRVIEIARTMIDAGDALAVMGNHEFNAICFHSSDGNGGFLRPRNSKNVHQHKAFLDEFSHDASLWESTIEWFQTLPLWLDLEGIRIIHACWDEGLITKLRNSYAGNQLTDELLRESVRRETWEYHAIETLLKGKEIPLPAGAHFFDKDGNKRQEIRIRWWDGGGTYKAAFMGPESARTHIPDDPIGGDHLIQYDVNDKPLFLGHYWMEGEPKPLARNIACLDFSVAKPGGKLVAYRWSGEKVLKVENFVWANRLD